MEKLEALNRLIIAEREIERLKAVIRALQKAYSTGTVDDAEKAWADARNALAERFPEASHGADPKPL